MMGYDLLHNCPVQRAKLFSQTTHLRSINTSTFKYRGACGVHAYDHQLFVFVNGLQIISDVALVFCQSLEKAGEDIVKRNIMVPRHNYLWLWQSIKEQTRLLKLVRTGALREV